MYDYFALHHKNIFKNLTNSTSFAIMFDEKREFFELNLKIGADKMKIGTGKFRYTMRGMIEVWESELLNKLHQMCYACHGGFKRDRAISIALKLSNDELEQAYWTIGNKGVHRVVSDEVKARELTLKPNFDCWVLSRIPAGEEYQSYFEKYVCGL